MKHKMNLFVSIGLVLLLFCLPVQVVSKTFEKDQVTNLIEQFYQHLKNGDTDGILQIITDPMLKEKRFLLQNNPTYSQSLMESYENINYKIKRIENVEEKNKEVVVHILNGKKLVKKVKFFCKKEGEAWKIAEEQVILERINKKQSN